LLTLVKRVPKQKASMPRRARTAVCKNSKKARE